MGRKRANSAKEEKYIVTTCVSLAMIDDAGGEKFLREVHQPPINARHIISVGTGEFPRVCRQDEMT